MAAFVYQKCFKNHISASDYLDFISSYTQLKFIIQGLLI